LKLDLPEPWRTLRRSIDGVAAGGLAAASLLVILGAVSAGLAPVALKTLVDHLATGESTTANARTYLGPLGLYVIALLLQRTCDQVQAVVQGYGEQRLTRSFAAQAFRHLLTLPLPLHLDARSGALAQTLAEGVLGLRLILTHLVGTLLPGAAQLAVTGLVLGATFGPNLGLLLVGTLAVYAGVFAWSMARLDGPMRAISASNIEAGGAAADSLMNVEAIKAFTAEPEFARRYGRVLQTGERHWRSFLQRRLQSGLAVAAVFGISLAGALAVGAVQVRSQALTLGGFTLLNACLLQIVRPLEMLGFAVRDIGQGLAYFARLSALLRQPGEPSGPDSPVPIGPADLVFDKVSFAFGPERPTLVEISFRAAPGRTIAIVGPSGAGKSSIIRLILRFYEPTQGVIRLDGRPLGALGLSALRQQVALVAQDTILLNDTIGANIALGRSGADLASIERAAAAARISDLLAELPEGLNTTVGERGLKLSGGEKQRVAIARSALKNARLVIFDEATAALDPTTERAVWSAMTALRGGATTLVITHRLATITQADRILVLDHGRIVEQGRHDDLLEQAGLYRRLWLAQNPVAAAGETLDIAGQA
jgi:ABC-type multidrug transport system fused ATPase/permease subunit